MLGAVIASYLFKEVPSGDEGYLTQMRSKIVSREHLNELGKELNLLSFVDSKVHKDQFWRQCSRQCFRGFGRGYLFRQGL